MLKYILISIVVLVIPFSLSAQSDSLDLELLSSTDYSDYGVVHYYDSTGGNSKEMIHSDEGFRPVKGILKGIFFLYQNFISEQIMAGCLYEMTCSNFGKHSIEMHGPIKGFFLSLDRLSRCTHMVVKEVPHYKFNDQTGKIIDIPEEY